MVASRVRAVQFYKLEIPDQPTEILRLLRLSTHLVVEVVVKATSDTKHEAVEAVVAPDMTAQTQHQVLARESELPGKVTTERHRHIQATAAVQVVVELVRLGRTQF